MHIRSMSFDRLDITVKAVTRIGQNGNNRKTKRYANDANSSNFHAINPRLDAGFVK